MTSSTGALLREPRFRVTRHRRLSFAITAVLLIVSLLGVILSWSSPIGAPVRPGLDFTGGTAIQVERRCGDSCGSLSGEVVARSLAHPASVQLLDGGRAIALRLAALTPAESGEVVESLNRLAGPLDPSGTRIDTIGPVLGRQLLQSSMLALVVSFLGVALFITARYDRLYAVLALFCLAHDVLITTGVFAWLGLLAGVEVDSLFAVALLTLAGYSVNDTVVVFDRIREQQQVLPDLTLDDQVDRAVAGTLTRSLYTSFTTELPILALVFFGGQTLFWFAVALAIGVAVGSWSSIGVVPPLLPLLGGRLSPRRPGPESGAPA
jgi:preprotein translocase subunit SecF